MENLETPKRRGWSIIRKAQVVTALIGAFVTTVKGGPSGDNAGQDFCQCLFHF
jgi:hypothetical protein